MNRHADTVKVFAVKVPSVSLTAPNPIQNVDAFRGHSTGVFCSGAMAARSAVKLQGKVGSISGLAKNVIREIDCLFLPCIAAVDHGQAYMLHFIVNKSHRKVGTFYKGHQDRFL